MQTGRQMRHTAGSSRTRGLPRSVCPLRTSCVLRTVMGRLVLARPPWRVDIAAGPGLSGQRSSSPGRAGPVQRGRRDPRGHESLDRGVPDNAGDPALTHSQTSDLTGPIDGPLKRPRPRHEQRPDFAQVVVNDRLAAVKAQRSDQVPGCAGRGVWDRFALRTTGVGTGPPLPAAHSPGGEWRSISPRFSAACVLDGLCVGLVRCLRSHRRGVGSCAGSRCSCALRVWRSRPRRGRCVWLV